MSLLPLERIVLTGFMGSGKTTLGRLLATRIGWSFVDLDDAIAGRVGLSVPDIFARYGEPRFRLEESLSLAGCLTRTRIVLALGGGAPESADNRRLLSESPNTAVVYLQGSFAALQSRCLSQATEPGAVTRPVFANSAIAEQRYAHRSTLYAEIATHEVNTSTRTPAELADHLQAILGLSQ